MNIALIGYGKMGKTIEEIAQARGHNIVLRIHIDNKHEFTTEAIQKADVAIEFTEPGSAFENIKTCLEAKVPVVSGSTGWLRKLAEIKEIAAKEQTAFLYSSNFSIGVNLFFELNKKLATLLEPYSEYEPVITEIHHTEKRDAPSGTAITLAEDIIENYVPKMSWKNTHSEDKSELEIISKREDAVPGTHIISYASPIDEIEIKHTAHSRKGFAQGAVLAGEYIAGKKGIFSMHDVLFTKG